MNEIEQSNVKHRKCIRGSQVGCVAVCVLVLPVPAFAYLDPGTGSLLIQSAIAIIAGAMFALKTYWYRIKSFFSSSKSDGAINIEVADKTPGVTDKAVGD